MAVHAHYSTTPTPSHMTSAAPSPAGQRWTTPRASASPAFLVADTATTAAGNTVLISAGDLPSHLPRQQSRRKEARAARVTMDLQGQHRALLPTMPVPVPQALDLDVQVQSRALCCASASTSGRPASAARFLLSHLYRHSVDDEIDLLLRIEAERLRAGLQDARRRHARAVLSAAGQGAARRLTAAEAGLELALARNAELDDGLRQAAAEAHAWRGVARSHEAVAAGLRAKLDHAIQTRSSRAAEGAAEDARSCCFEQQEGGAGAADDDEAAPRWRTRACQACGAADACVLLLPCRHLCLCGACEAAVEACPMCAATKNASLRVLLS